MYAGSLPRSTGRRLLRLFVTRVLGLGVMCLLVLPDAAWAVQSHGGDEGLVAHQLGHVLFCVGMLYLLYRLRVKRPIGAGWRAFRAFLWLLVFWNLLTFTGHWLNEIMPAEKFLRKNQHIVAMTIESFGDAVYYLTRLDHLLLVPAMICLLVALQRWRSQA